MIKSMTGYGRGEIKEKGYYITVEIKSLNHRFLDINCRMNKLLSGLEEKVREFVSKQIARGRIELNIGFEVYERSITVIEIDENLLSEYLRVFTDVKSKFELEGFIKVSDLVYLPEVIRVKNEDLDLEEIWELLKLPLGEAINNLIDMRNKEGIKLYDDIVNRMGKISDIVKEIEDLSFVMVEDYRKRLEQRIKELGVDIDPNRMAMEIAIIADKSCIAEEITRLKSHIVQFKDSLKEEGSIGKKLDFIVQEMNREANTIASKSIDYRISNKVIDLKNEIEKIREQVQNIE
ncbi:YicC/YloC family endoribonuclease [Thermoanaerobacter sp. CM-CNRG TB177]|uniref:YicC/YloC family endoribonuclease n=1 Tax=Thermoanaerobacter sp. CM-CNRG TB177 TaxID=2800659 RepID=UPI001BDF4687|nr:YicC/YloC family endoribonuclease [Thermoanaerobacter sp. CM-CNRG TB177]MBT1279689.1 YicC family protein [Thermoanaerobacter sp. CM-CNRG TB177]